MTWVSLGSLALPFQLQRHGVQLRTEIARLGQNLSTGTVTDPARHLQGNTAPLAAITARLARNDAYEQATRMAATMADSAQTALGQLDGLRQTAAGRLLGAATSALSGPMMTSTGKAAFSALTDAVSALSLNVAGAAGFSGTASDHAPLVSADTMIQTLSPLVAGLETADQVLAAVQGAFLDPGGLFDTDFYQGGDAAPGAVLADGTRAPTLPTAADPALRAVLAGLAGAAMLSDPALSLSDDQRIALAQGSSERLSAATTGMTALQATLGEGQERLDTGLTRLSAERDALDLARQSLIGADPYEAATQLDLAQTRLETIYAITARTARLSLTEYL